MHKVRITYVTNTYAVYSARYPDAQLRNLSTPYEIRQGHEGGVIASLYVRVAVFAHSKPRKSWNQHNNDSTSKRWTQLRKCCTTNNNMQTILTCNVIIMSKCRIEYLLCLFFLNRK